MTQEKLKIVSICDGISCGQEAIIRAGFEVEEYYASEIKKYAISVTQKNFPNTIQIGDCTKIDFTKFENIDILIGGTPCQNFSRARTSNIKTRDGLSGDKSCLFYEYYRALKEIKPKYFLLENVIMPKEDEEIISKLLGVIPVRINSNLFSFQNRDRLYWTNIDFQNYKDTDFEYCKKFKVNKTPSREKMWGNGINGACPNVTHRNKINCLTLKQDRWRNSGLVEFDEFCRYLTTRELELAQTLPIGYTNGLTKNQAENVLGDCWTVDVISHIFKGLKK